MTTSKTFIPTSSQTVGPFFKIGMQWLLDRTPSVPAGGEIELHGRVVDCNGNPVPDAVLEFWGTSGTDTPSSNSLPQECTVNFRRAPTDDFGRFSVVVPKPDAPRMGDGEVHSPHFLVLVFMRGLLRNLVTRVYLADEPGIASDPVLQGVPAERRNTLLAISDGPGSYRWDIILQGQGETAFFAW